jgi:hypothetical protein
MRAWLDAVRRKGKDLLMGELYTDLRPAWLYISDL